MLYVGLTGGIAAGKTLAMDFYRKQGAVLIESDSLARQVVDPTLPQGELTLARIAEEFGVCVINPDGTLNRAELGRKIFGKTRGKRLARQRLNRIMHPQIQEKAAKILAATDKGDVVLHDIPLLAELLKARAYRRNDFDRIIVITAGRKLRIRRMVENRGLRPRDAQVRIRAQAPDRERRKIADIIIDNNGDLANTYEQLEKSWHTLSARNAAPSA